MRSPLSPYLYLVRNLGKTLPLVGVITLAVMLISGIVALVNSIPFSVRETYSYARHQLAVMPRNDYTVSPELLKRFERAPVPVERMFDARVIGTQVKSIVGKWPFIVVCIKQEDIGYFLKKVGNGKIEGRTPKAGEPEAVISEPVSRNLKLKIGNTLLGPNNKDSYSPMEVKVVGIVQSPEWFMLGSYEYHAANHFPPYDNVMVFARTPREQRWLDRWATRAFRGEKVELFAYHMLERSTNEMFTTLYKILNVIIATLVLVLTFLMAMLMNIYQSQRLVEFGLLEAIGYTRKALLKRVILESVVVIATGWALGVLGGYGLLKMVDATLMYPNAFSINVFDKSAYLYTAMIPLAILAAAILTVAIRFRKFDPVAIVERRLA